MENEDKVSIKYYDRINKQLIELEVPVDVAKFIKKSDKKMQRKQSVFKKYNISIEEALQDELNYDRFIEIGKLNELDKQNKLEHFIDEKKELLKEKFNNLSERKKQEIINKLLEETDDETIKKIREIILTKD